MVGVAQLVEPRVVIPVVVGSNPIVHPNQFVQSNLALDRFVLLYKTSLLFNNSTRLEEVQNFAKVAELVDALDLGSSRATCESSSLSFRTITSLGNSVRGLKGCFKLAVPIKFNNDKCPVR